MSYLKLQTSKLQNTALSSGRTNRITWCKSSTPHDWNQDKAKIKLEEVLEKHTDKEHEETEVAGKGIAIGSAIQEKNSELIQLQIFSFVSSGYLYFVENIKEWYNRKTTERNCPVSDFVENIEFWYNRQTKKRFRILVLLPVGTGVLLKMLKTVIWSRWTKMRHAPFNVKKTLFHMHFSLKMLDLSGLIWAIGVRRSCVLFMKLLYEPLFFPIF